jgi:hypothetical protein
MFRKLKGNIAENQAPLVCEVVAGAMQDFLDVEVDFAADFVAFLFFVGREVAGAGVGISEELWATTAVDV